jgi:hypothetical protein
MSTAQLTQQQQATLNELLKKFADRLLPAKLKNTHRNGLLLSDFCVSRGLPINADTMYDAAKAIYATLDWTVKPAKLVLEEQNDKPAKAVPIQTLENDLEKKRRAGEAADKYATEQSEYEQSALELVAQFLPYTKRGAIDYRKKDEVQALLRAHIGKEKSRNVRMKDVHAVVAEHIRKEYDAIERASERL